MKDDTIAILSVVVVIFLILIAISFQLGWSMRGDKIYGSMFSGTAAIAAKLPAAQGVK